MTELVSGHHIASIAVAARNDRTCYYRFPYENGEGFVLVGGLPESVFAPADPVRILTVVIELISVMPLHHKTLITGTFQANCVNVESGPDFITGHHRTGADLIATFDEFGRLTDLRLHSA